MNTGGVVNRGPDQPVDVPAVAVLPAAGSGTRLSKDLPKALVEVAGRPMLLHALDAMLAADVVHHTVVVLPQQYLQQVSELLAPYGPSVSAVGGGAERGESVLRGLHAAATRCPAADTVLIHDAARPFTPVAVFQAVALRLRQGAQAVVPVMAVPDTIKEVDAGGTVVRTPPRSALRAVQTPQGFSLPALLEAHGGADPGDAPTDDALLLERAGCAVHTVPGAAAGMKITTPFDLRVAEAVLADG